MKKIISTVTAIALVASMLVAPSADAKAKAPKLSSKKMTVKVNQTATLKVKNSKVKVKWSVSKGKKNIKLSSKKKSSVKIKGLKAGSATVVAKVGKKKLKCTITVKPKSSTTTKKPTPTPAPVAKTAISKFEFVMSNILSVTLSKKQALDIKAFRVMVKRFANSSYLKTLEIDEVNTLDQQTYLLNMKDMFADGSYYKVSVVTSEGTISKEAVYDYTNNGMFDIDDQINCMKSDKIDESYLLMGGGYAEIVAKETSLPKGVSAKLVFSNDNASIQNKICVSGSINVAGVQKGTITCINEKGKKCKINLTFVVGDENTLSTYIKPYTIITTSGSQYEEYIRLCDAVVGGSGIYKYEIVSADGVTAKLEIEEDEVHLQVKGTTLGQKKVKVKITDNNKTAILEVTINVQAGVKITGKITDANGKVVTGRGCTIYFENSVITNNMTNIACTPDEKTGIYSGIIAKNTYNILVNGTCYATNVNISSDKTLNIQLKNYYLINFKGIPEDVKELTWYDEKGEICYDRVALLKKGTYKLWTEFVTLDVTKQVQYTANFTVDGKISEVTATKNVIDALLGTVVKDTPQIIDAKKAKEYAIYYKFVPTEDGLYDIYSTSDNTDAYVTIYDEEGNYIDDDDDGGDDCNFYVAGVQLEKGKTYYIAIEAYNYYASDNVELHITDYEEDD